MKKLSNADLAVCASVFLEVIYGFEGASVEGTDAELEAFIDMLELEL